MYYEEGKYRKIFECLVFNVFKVFQAWSKSQLFKGEKPTLIKTKMQHVWLWKVCLM